MGARFDISESGPDEVRVEMSGRLDVDGVATLWPDARSALQRHQSGRVVVGAAGISYCDGAGAAMLIDLETEQTAHGGELVIEELPDEFQPLLDLLRRSQPTEAETPRARPPWIARVGAAADATARDLTALVGDIGSVASALAGAVVRPARVRWGDAVAAAQSAGVNALPVVVLISLLLGLILAYQTAATFVQYGADVFLADMLGISLLRELAPLMTAITLTARSGSAFAAEIGTMRVNEEVDALDTMGLEPVSFLVTPRVIAAVLMTPFLTVFASMAGLLGGLFVWITSLDLPPRLYLRRVFDAVDTGDFVGGLVKALAFGAVVAAIGCIRGLQTRGGAAAVGRSTTRSVVSGIVAIALVDLLFAVVYYHLGI